MKTPSRLRDAILAAGLFFLLAALTAAAALGSARPAEAVPLDSASNAPDGARALALWLVDIGYDVRTDVEAAFAVPEGTGLVLLLEPFDLSEEDVDVLEAWVREGGSLLVAGETFEALPLLRRLGLERRYTAESVSTLVPVLPLLSAPPVTSPLRLEVSGYFEAAPDAGVPLIALPEGPVVLHMQLGDGQVILSAAVRPFTNAGLKDPGSAEFVLNLIGTAPHAAQVWFDEWHHGRRPAAALPGGPGFWLRETSPGRAVLFTTLAVFIWIALSGRSFGRPLSGAADAVRRAPLEYVTALAGLNQRLGNRSALLESYRTRLKRSLGRRARIDPNLPDDRFLAALESSGAAEDLKDLEALLQALNQPDPGEADMVRLAADASKRMHP